jgi:hypothetical protein
MDGNASGGRSRDRPPRQYARDVVGRDIMTTPINHVSASCNVTGCFFCDVEREAAERPTFLWRVIFFLAATLIGLLIGGGVMWWLNLFAGLIAKP